jgi:dipeptidyl aminopeptidase/acylaminoacyl peptidase
MGVFGQNRAFRPNFREFTVTKAAWAHRIGLALVAALALPTLSLAASPSEPGLRAIHRFLTVAISPDGRRVASVEGDSGSAGGAPTIRDLVIRTVDGGQATTVPLPCGKVAECWPSSPVWTPDGQALVFALRTPGTHDRSIYSVDPSGGRPTLLLKFDGSIIDLKYDRDGRLAMLATVGATKEVGATEAGAPFTGELSGPPPEQRIAVLDGGKLAFQSPPGMFVYEFDWLAGGQGFVGTAAPGDGDNNWWVAKLYRFTGDQAQVLFASPNPQHQIANPRVSPDGRTVAFISGLMSDFGSTGGDIYAQDLAGGEARDVTPGLHASATSLGWSCDGRLLARVLDNDKAQIAEVATGAPAPLKPLWSGQETVRGAYAGLALGCPSRITAAVHETFTVPEEIEVGTIGDWRDLTHLNAGLTAPATVQSLTWTSDGARVQGWLLLPAKAMAGKLPLIVSVHGGPAAAAEPSFVGPGTDRKLLERGYALLFPNPRGSFGQGEAFTLGNVRDFGHGDLRDILAGVDAAERAAPIDDARLGLTGGSYGGFMTMWAVTQTDRFKAGVAAAGISDWLSYYGENGIDQWMIPYFGASAYDDPAIYGQSSAINYIKAVKTPVFEFVGAQDIECPPAQTQEFWHALRDRGVATSIAIYPGEGHGLRDPAHRADAERRSLDWFDKYLKPAG